MHFLFNVSKAAAAAGYLCKRNGDHFDMLRLIKALYLADRQTLLDVHRTITGDDMFSMKNGPVLSTIYDLIRNRCSDPVSQTEWNQYFCKGEGSNDVRLLQMPDVECLSELELTNLDNAMKEVRGISAIRLIEKLHSTLPEWKNPGTSSFPIEPTVILQSDGLSEEEIEIISSELESSNNFKRQYC